MKLNLRKFDMAQIKDDQTVVLIGKRNTGKSYLVQDVMYNHMDLPVGTVVSPTETLNPFFSEFVPPLFIHEDVSAGLLQNVLKRQELVRNSIKRQTSLYGACNIDPRAFLVLDDCLAQNGWIRAKEMRTMFMNGRHYKLFLLITMQFALGIPPDLRTNIDFVFILRENLMNNRKRLYEHYAGMFPTFDIFCQVMDQCTENYECLVINNNAKSNRIEDQVFWYKATPHPKFRLGANEFWALSAECTRREEAARAAAGDDDDYDDGDPFSAAGVKPKNRPMITVKKTTARY